MKFALYTVALVGSYYYGEASGRYVLRVCHEKKVADNVTLAIWGVVTFGGGMAIGSIANALVKRM